MESHTRPPWRKLFWRTKGANLREGLFTTSTVEPLVSEWPTSAPPLVRVARYPRAASIIETDSLETEVMPRHSNPELPSNAFHSAAVRSLPPVTASMFRSLIKRFSSSGSA